MFQQIYIDLFHVSSLNNSVFKLKTNHRSLMVFVCKLTSKDVLKPAKKIVITDQAQTFQSTIILPSMKQKTDISENMTHLVYPYMMKSSN